MTRDKLRPADTKCHLLDLPAELRNRIYSYVAANHCREDGTIPTPLRVQRSVGPTLLAVNKQICKEFSSLYYSEEFFRISIFDPRIQDWNNVSDRHLIEAICEGKLCSLSTLGGVGKTQAESLSTAKFRARIKACSDNVLSGVLDMEHIGAGRWLLYELPFSVLGPCFEEERVRFSKRLGAQ